MEWGSDDKGDAGAEFEVGHLAPDAFFAEVPAVVAEEEDDGVVGELQVVEFVEDAAELGVHVRDAGAVTVDEGAGEVVVEWALFWDAVVGAEFGGVDRGLMAASMLYF